MKALSSIAKTYILGVLLLGAGLTAWTVRGLDWSDPLLYLLAALGAAAQTLKVEGPTPRTNYSLAWFVYGFAFLASGLPAAIFVVVVAHLVEWAWHKYPWFIQSFNIGSHVLSVFLAGLAFEWITRGAAGAGHAEALGLVAAGLIFVLGNHFLVGLVVKLARGQSFRESGVFDSLTLFLDFTVLSMGAVTALIWSTHPAASLLNLLPLYLLYKAIRVPALERKLREADQ